jgi:hypothetical protein
MLFNFEKKFGLYRHRGKVAEDLRSGHVGRVAAANVKVNLKQMEDFLERVSIIFNEDQKGSNRRLFDLVNELPRMSSALLDHAKRSLGAASADIECCSIRRVKKETGGVGKYIWGTLVVVIIIAVVIFVPGLRVGAAGRRKPTML